MRSPILACCLALTACSTNPGAADAGPPDTGPSHPPDTGTCKVVDSSAPKDGAKPVDARKPPGEECGPGEAGNDSGANSGPPLSELTVGGRKLVPAFSPAISDYYVQCSAGSNSVTVTAKAPSAATVALSIETPGSPLGSVKSITKAAALQSMPVSLEDGQALVATVAAGSAQREYWVRCLPTGFPPGMEWQTHSSGCERPPGYYIIGFMSLPGGDSGYAVVFDTNGVPVWFHDNGSAVYDAESLLPGAVSFGPDWQVRQLGVGVTYPVMSPYGGGSPSPPDEHELRIVDPTHYYGISSAEVYGIDLTGLTVNLPDGGVESYGPGSNMYGCYVEEFNPATGSLYWKWNAVDHFDMGLVETVKGDGDLAGSEPNPLHCNSIDVDPSNGDLLLSGRNASAIWYVDHSMPDGKILWMMGGNCAANKDGAVCVPVDDPFVGQHDARLLDWKETCSGGSGQISLFDDESYTSNPARGVIYDVTVNDGSGCAGGTTGKTGAKKVWEYKTWKNVPTQVCGGMRVTADDTRIIDWGQSAPVTNGLVFTEVDEAGHDLLDLVCPDGSSSFRAVKVPLGEFDLGTLRLTAGQ